MTAEWVAANWVTAEKEEEEAGWVGLAGGGGAGGARAAPAPPLCGAGMVRRGKQEHSGPGGKTRRLAGGDRRTVAKREGQMGSGPNNQLFLIELSRNRQ